MTACIHNICTRITLLWVTILIGTQVQAQEAACSWQWQNTLPQGNRLNDVVFPVS